MSLVTSTNTVGSASRYDRIGMRATCDPLLRPLGQVVEGDGDYALAARVVVKGWWSNWTGLRTMRIGAEPSIGSTFMKVSLAIAWGSSPKESRLIALAAIATVATFSVPAAFAETSQSVREVTEEAAPAAKLNAGEMLYSNGSRLAPIYRVNAAGNPQIILSGKLVTVPASTIASVGGTTTTSLSKKEVPSAK